MNRGSALTVGKASDSGIASMRPRFMNRGSPEPRGSASADRAGFNEAPIHESGKYA